MTENIFYPQSILSHPFGSDGPEYDFYNVTQLLVDLEPHSGFDELYDPVQIISQSPVSDMHIRGDIINMIVSNSL